MFIETVYAAEEAAEATEQASEGLLASLGINLPLFIFQLINFAIVAVILWFLILKPLTKKLAERQKLIDESISNAERATKQLEEAETEKRALIAKARAESELLLSKVEKQAAELKEEAAQNAKRQAEKVLAETKKVIEEEKNKMFTEVRKQTVELVIEATQKIIGEKITSEKDKKLIEEAVKNLWSVKFVIKSVLSVFYEKNPQTICHRAFWGHCR